MILFSIAAVLAVLALIGVYAGFIYACGRSKDPDWDDPESLNRSMWKNHPISIPDANQWLRDQNARDVSIKSEDGLTLRGKWVPAEQPRATIILFHGYRSSYLTDFGGIFKLYHSWGLNLLLVRQRAHGESEGKYITYGVQERRDVLRWIDFHNREFGSGPVFLGGMSMGAATVLFASGEELPDNVRGITADCGFSSPGDIIGSVMQKDFHLPPKPILPVLNWFTRALAGFDLWECRSTEAVKRARVPILMIHGTADDFVPCRMTEEAYAACASEKELILVEGAGHGMSFMKDSARVKPALYHFFDRNITAYTQLEETK